MRWFRMKECDVGYDQNTTIMGKILGHNRQSCRIITHSFGRYETIWHDLEFFVLDLDWLGMTEDDLVPFGLVLNICNRYLTSWSGNER